MVLGRQGCEAQATLTYVELKSAPAWRLGMLRSADNTLFQVFAANLPCQGAVVGRSSCSAHQAEANKVPNRCG